MSDRKTPRYASDLMAGQVALVTGSGSGMGRATALEMASCGARLALFARREEPLEETAEMIRTAGARRLSCPATPAMRPVSKPRWGGSRSTTDSLTFW